MHTVHRNVEIRAGEETPLRVTAVWPGAVKVTLEKDDEGSSRAGARVRLIPDDAALETIVEYIHRRQRFTLAPGGWTVHVKPRRAKPFSTRVLVRRNEVVDVVVPFEPE